MWPECPDICLTVETNPRKNLNQEIDPTEDRTRARCVRGNDVTPEQSGGQQLVRHWCRQFIEGRQLVHDEERSVRPSIITDDLVKLVWERIMENRRFTITELSSHYPQISRYFLHEIAMEHLFRKLFRWVPRQLIPEHKAKRMESAFTFLQRYQDDGDEFLDRTITGDQTWVAYITPGN